jgi:SAM-dependent methyltransferase
MVPQRDNIELKSLAPPASSNALSAVDAHLAELAATPGTRGRASARKEQGSHYTPPELVAWILDRAMQNRALPLRALDPACGAGNFLVAVAERLIARGVDAQQVLSACVFGVDIDRRAVELCRAQLLALLPSTVDASERALVATAIESHVREGDALQQSIAEITGVRAFDLIVGNPPFLNQLESATSASRAQAERVRRRTKGAVTGYADLSAAFLLESCDHLAPGGVVGFVMPQSFLATADARASRAALVASMRVCALWTADERLFEDASVRVAAVVAERPERWSFDIEESQFVRAFGASFTPLATVESSVLQGTAPWSAIFAETRGVPSVLLKTEGTLRDVARITADFRDQFYGLRGAIVDRADADPALFPPLVSTRHVDLAHCRWGEVPVRILFERFAAPRADRAVLEQDASMAAWVRTRLVPKVLVATQTKVMEAVVDESGAWLPVVPILTATVRDDVDIDLWMLAAAIASPVVTAEAARISYGTALSAAAIKLSATQLLAMPLPTDRAAWIESAGHFRAASSAESPMVRARHLHAFAETSCRAYRLDPQCSADVCAFWTQRLRPRGGALAPRE